MAIGFALRTFRIYLAGAPYITIIAVHKPICLILTGKKNRLNPNGLYEFKASRYSTECRISER